MTHIEVPLFGPNAYQYTNSNIRIYVVEHLDKAHTIHISTTIGQISFCAHGLFKCCYRFEQSGQSQTLFYKGTPICQALYTNVEKTEISSFTFGPKLSKLEKVLL